VEAADYDADGLLQKKMQERSAVKCHAEIAEKFRLPKLAQMEAPRLDHKFTLLGKRKCQEREF
jgi:hypothetical protein